MRNRIRGEIIFNDGDGLDWNHFKVLEGNGIMVFWKDKDSSPSSQTARIEFFHRKLETQERYTKRHQDAESD